MWAEFDGSHSYAEHFPLQSRPVAGEMMSACNTQLNPRWNHEWKVWEMAKALKPVAERQNLGEKMLS